MKEAVGGSLWKEWAVAPWVLGKFSEVSQAGAGKNDTPQWGAADQSSWGSCLLDSLPLGHMKLSEEPFPGAHLRPAGKSARVLVGLDGSVGCHWNLLRGEHQEWRTEALLDIKCGRSKERKTYRNQKEMPFLLQCLSSYDMSPGKHDVILIGEKATFASGQRRVDLELRGNKLVTGRKGQETPLSLLFIFQIKFFKKFLTLIIRQLFNIMPK